MESDNRFSKEGCFRAQTSAKAPPHRSCLELFQNYPSVYDKFVKNCPVALDSTRWLDFPSATPCSMLAFTLVSLKTAVGVGTKRDARSILAAYGEGAKLALARACIAAGQLTETPVKLCVWSVEGSDVARQPDPHFHGAVLLAEQRDVGPFYVTLTALVNAHLWLECRPWDNGANFLKICG